MKINFTKNIIIILFLIVSQKSYSQYSFINQYSVASSLGLKAYSCAEAKDGSFLIAAFGYNQAVMDSNLFILKVDRLGDTLWTKFYDFSNTNNIPYHILATPDTGFIVCGDNFILKANQLGDVEWLKLMNSKTGKWIEKIPEGYMICLSDLATSNVHHYILKIDHSGNYIFSRELQGGLQDWLYQIVRLSSGDYAISVWAYSHTSGHTYLLLSDSLLNVKAYVDIEGSNMRCIESRDKDLVMTFEAFYGMGIIKMDTTGNIKWHKSIQPVYRPAGIDTTSDGAIITYGSKYWLADSGIYISKFDTSGALLKTDRICCDDRPFLKSTKDGGYITFSHDTTMNNTFNFFKVDTSGFSHCIRAESGSADSATYNPFLFVFAGNWFVSHSMQLFDDTAAIYSGCITNRLCTTVGIAEEMHIKEDLKIFPNPNNSKFRLQSNSLLNEKARVLIYDQLGIKVFEKDFEFINEASSVIEPNLESGLYYLNVISRNGMRSEKLVIVCE